MTNRYRTFKVHAGEEVDNSTYGNNLFGWIPSLPDIRDKPVTAFLPKASSDLLTGPTAVPKFVIDRSLFSPIEDQGTLGSCTANAAVGLMEYFQRALDKNHTNLSRTFLYKVTRKLMGVSGDTGAYLRDTAKAMRLFGTLPEENYRYVVRDFDREPTAFDYAMAANFKSYSYFRIDLPQLSTSDILLGIKARLLRACPLMCGFTCYESIVTADGSIDGKIPVPSAGERAVGGHAVIIMGYDDNAQEFHIRNSWGDYWGSEGYGKLPYWYLENRQMMDIWGILRQDWVNTGKFV